MVYNKKTPDRLIIISREFSGSIQVKDIAKKSVNIDGLVGLLLGISVDKINWITF